jgi:heat shock protein HslJ
MNRTVCLLALVVLAASATKSWAQEQPLICFGNEPFWRLDLIEQGKASFSTPDTPAVDYVGTSVTLEPRNESVWRGRPAGSDGGDLVAFLRQGGCSDGMSDTVHPYSINVSLPDGRFHAGCCRLAAATNGSTMLENTTWRLTELPGQALPSDQGANAVTVNFNAGQVHGFSGCNQFTGSYNLEGDRLVLGPLGATMMACAEPAMSVETAFLKSFAGALQDALTGDDLTLTPEGGGALRFARAAPARLEGVEWEVTGYNNGRQAVVSPMTDTRLTLTFGDGRVSGSSGCNRFEAAFTVEDHALTIQPLATTRMACDDAVMSQEQEFLRALQSATTWQIDRGMLDIHRADGERVLTANGAAP